MSRSVVRLVHAASDIILFSKPVDGLNILIGQLEVEALKIALNAVGSQALRQNNISTASIPVEENLGGGPAVFLGDGVDGRVLELVAASKRRIGLNLNTVFQA